MQSWRRIGFAAVLLLCLIDLCLGGAAVVVVVEPLKTFG